MSFSIGSSGAGMGGPRGMIRMAGRSDDVRAFDTQIVLRLLAFVRPYWQRMSVAFLLMLIASGLTLLTPYLIKIAIDEHITNGDLAGLDRIAMWTTLAFLGIYFTTAGQRYLLGWVGQQVLATLRNQLFIHLQKLSLSY
ncbi:MAG: hypothetical protein KDE53_26210, partial [Caldilineaceae bacterium]|nr:hypothetical protein [Caldilineaceae bacterium]